MIIFQKMLKNIFLSDSHISKFKIYFQYIYIKKNTRDFQEVYNNMSLISLGSIMRNLIHTKFKNTLHYNTFFFKRVYNKIF